MKTIDKIIETALRTLYSDLSTLGDQWFGRERELVSLFVFGHILELCDSKSAAFGRGQIGIEVAVPQIEKGGRHKTLVCKDIVIWPKSKMTIDPSQSRKAVPLAVLEWKCMNRRDKGQGKRKQHDSDIRWLKKFAHAARKNKSEFTGYAVWVDQCRGSLQMACTRVKAGDVDRSWLLLPARRN